MDGELFLESGKRSIKIIRGVWNIEFGVLLIREEVWKVVFERTIRSSTSRKKAGRMDKAAKNGEAVPTVTRVRDGCAIGRDMMIAWKVETLLAASKRKRRPTDAISNEPLPSPPNVRERPDQPLERHSGRLECQEP